MKVNMFAIIMNGISAVLLVIALQTAVAADPVPIKGIYSLMKGMEEVNESVISLPYVSGVSIRASWNALEPEEGKYKWEYIDRALEKAKKTKKKVMLRVLPGVYSPEWIYKAGVASITLKDTNTYHGTYGELRRVPIPWDDTYIKKWARFIKALGARYNLNETLLLVHIAGPTVFSAEMHLPKRGEGRELIEASGYSVKKITKAWESVIDDYLNAFPSKSFALNIALPIENDGTMDLIIGYGQEKLREKLYIQGNWLSARTNVTFYPYKKILELHQKDKAEIGFQMLATATNKKRMGPLDKAIQTGLDAGACYFEIYESDLTEKKNESFFQILSDKLK